ncbi:MAG: methyltransferase domain-containing protein [Rhodothermales bacterium]|nr:methyltransferase domain-containing protein [Rhodothermales bacterium]
MTRPRLLGVACTVYVVLLLGAAWASMDRATWVPMVASLLAAGGLLAWIRLSGAPGYWVILAVAVVVRVAWIPVPPILSDDAFRYAWDGQLVTEGGNPYEFVPADSTLASFHDSEFFGQLNSAAFHSVYPPVSQAAFALAWWGGGGDFGGFYRVWKLLLLLLELAGMAWLARMVSREALLLYAWHPLVIIAGAGQAHTDVLLMVPLVLAVHFARKQRWNVTAALMAVAAHVKIWPLLVLPAYLRKPRAVATGVAVGIVLSLPFAAPWVLENVRQSLDLYVRYFEFNAGPYYGLKKLFEVFTGQDWSKQLGPALRWLFFLGVAGVWVRAFRKRAPDPADILFWILGLYLVTATTVHPWYVYPILVLAALRDRPAWGWQWLGLLSIGTYLLYVDGPYWWFVILGWLGFAVLGLLTAWPVLIRQALERRAAWKSSWVSGFLPDGLESILDLGGGEGYVARRLQESIGAQVTVAEVADLNRTDVSFTVYDGMTLPFEKDAFAAGYAIFSLHHAKDPEGLLREMRRTVSGDVVVLESVIEDRVSAWALQVLDPLVNGLRTWPPAVDASRPSFATAEEWRRRFERAGYQITAESIRYNVLHRKHLFRLSPKAS